MAARPRDRPAAVRRHARSRSLDGHRQAGRGRARARQRLHRLHRGGAPAQADHAGRRDPAEPVPAADRADRRRASSRAPCSRPTRSAATGSTSSRTATAPGWRSPTPSAPGRPPPASAPPRSARCAPRGAAARTSRARSTAMHETVRRLGNPDFHVTALIARWRATTGHAHLGQLRPPARLPRRRRRQPQRARRPGPPAARHRRRRTRRSSSASAGCVSGERLDPGHRRGASSRRVEGGGTFGEDGLRRALERAESPTAAATAMAIQHAVTDCWREPLEDDATIVVLTIG